VQAFESVPAPLCQTQQPPPREVPRFHAPQFTLNVLAVTQNLAMKLRPAFDSLASMGLAAGQIQTVLL
jgi:hypothetical protein